MQASQEVKEKLLSVIGNLICRCLEEAHKVPYILDQEQVVNILVEDPELFEKLVRDENLDSTEFSRGTLTAKIDILRELGQFEALDTLDLSFSGPIESDAELSPIVNLVNELSRMFEVYVNNTTTIFEREFELFMVKYRQSLRKVGMTIGAIELTPGDMSGLERRADSYLTAGQFLQAFSFDRLLNCPVITRDAAIIPSVGYSFNRHLIQSAQKNTGLFDSLVKFILRVSYISRGTWQELFDILASQLDIQPEKYTRAELVDLIQKDVIFGCNLLGEPLSDVKVWTLEKRRMAIENRLAAASLRANTTRPASPVRRG